MFKIFKMLKLAYLAHFIINRTILYFTDFKRWDPTARNLCEIKIVLPTTAFDITCVTWQGTKYGRPEDDTVVSKHGGGVW
jgi:hypothetical protein